MSLPPPPPGIHLQDTQVPRLLGVSISTFTLALIAICLRFTARRLTRLPLWWDDWLMLLAIAAATTQIFMLITYMINHGLGRHIWTGPPDAALAWAKGVFVSEISYACIICSVKFSLLAFYWRIFKQSKIRIPIYILTAVVSAWGVAMCQPVSAFWTQYMPIPSVHNSFTCGVNVNRFFDGNAIPNIITDAALLILPMPFIWHLHLPRAPKLALSSVFALGIFVVCVSIARFTFIISLDLKSPDITWNYVNVQIWSAVECNVGITCACLPSLRPILNLVLFGSIDRNHRRGGNDPSPIAGVKGNSPWYSHLRKKVVSRQNVLVSIKEGAEDGFIRLVDRPPQDSRVTAGMSAHDGSRIHVRTEFHVEPSNERPGLNSEATG